MRNNDFLSLRQRWGCVVSRPQINSKPWRWDGRWCNWCLVGTSSTAHIRALCTDRAGFDYFVSKRNWRCPWHTSCLTVWLEPSPKSKTEYSNWLEKKAPICTIELPPVMQHHLMHSCRNCHERNKLVCFLHKSAPFHPRVCIKCWLCLVDSDFVILFHLFRGKDIPDENWGDNPLSNASRGACRYEAGRNLSICNDPHSGWRWECRLGCLGGWELNEIAFAYLIECRWCKETIHHRRLNWRAPAQSTVWDRGLGHITVDQFRGEVGVKFSHFQAYLARHTSLSTQHSIQHKHRTSQNASKTPHHDKIQYSSSIHST